MHIFFKSQVYHAIFKKILQQVIHEKKNEK